MNWMLWRVVMRERVVGVLRREIVEHAPLLRRHHATGNAPTHHHDVFLAGLAQVAVVLLIAAVKLQELIIVLGEVILPLAMVAAIVLARVGIAVLISRCGSVSLPHQSLS